MKWNMAPVAIGVVGLGMVIVVWFAVYENYRSDMAGGVSNPHGTPNQTGGGVSGSSNGAVPLGETIPQGAAVSPDVPSVSVPLDGAGLRVTKKPFGIYIDPATSPVQPERFRGYHTGADFEIFPGEQDTAVSVRAVCQGTIAVKEHASGYGGVVVERCTIGGGPVTVVYGHLALASAAPMVGATVGQGDVIGLLGAAGSADTDGERKHLHLGIHKGAAIDILGYVSGKQLLTGWLDPCELFCK